jgi:hypothetical protein
VRAFETRQKPLPEALSALEIAKKQGFLSHGAKKARKNRDKTVQKVIGLRRLV